MNERNCDCFDNSRCPAAPFVTAFAHDYGQKIRVCKAGKVQALNRVGVVEDCTKQAGFEQKQVGKSDISFV